VYAVDTRELAKTDLNLLISLQVLLEECNVSRAAERLFITQPAMSKTLSRLRALFDDPLFTRVGHGMRPTPRALELATALEQVLGDIRQLLSARPFEPASFQGEVSLALSEYLGVALLPPLMAKLAVAAPQLYVRVITRVENQLEELALGRLDFAIHIRQANYGDDYRVAELGGSAPAILVREGHPLAGQQVDWELLARFPRIRLYVTDSEQVELQRLTAGTAAEDRLSHGTLEISHLLTALEVLRQTDYFMPAPAFVLLNRHTSEGIAALPFPHASEFSIDYALVSHRRTANSPLHNWLWEQITCTIRELRTPQRFKMRQRIAAGT